MDTTLPLASDAPSDAKSPEPPTGWPIFLPPEIDEMVFDSMDRQSLSRMKQTCRKFRNHIYDRGYLIRRLERMYTREGLKHAITLTRIYEYIRYPCLYAPSCPRSCTVRRVGAILDDSDTANKAAIQSEDLLMRLWDLHTVTEAFTRYVLEQTAMRCATAIDESAAITGTFRLVNKGFVVEVRSTKEPHASLDQTFSAAEVARIERSFLRIELLRLMAKWKTAMTLISRLQKWEFEELQTASFFMNKFVRTREEGGGDGLRRLRGLAHDDADCRMPEQEDWQIGREFSVWSFKAYRSIPAVIPLFWPFVGHPTIFQRRAVETTTFDADSPDKPNLAWDRYASLVQQPLRRWTPLSWLDYGPWIFNDARRIGWVYWDQGRVKTLGYGSREGVAEIWKKDEEEKKGNEEESEDESEHLNTPGHDPTIDTDSIVFMFWEMVKYAAPS
ncbi:hypothetical protein QBC46DRAFT_405439 [Diplogelasinospora grovesii]|uniref:F-box domain-containing protein n=1 Tax=Diplogelasinospora grovesii TaxID=303347 RepID=A0AAN6NDC0_9PEZI|nr:hypothetical protein QBC46DRAFT_405439 [Diplogelasinospora grovesii]